MCLESRYPRRFSKLYINDPQVLELTLLQSYLPLVYAAHFLHSTKCSTWPPLLLGGQRRCRFKTRPRLVHMTGAKGIEPQIPRSRVQRLNHSVTCSTHISIYITHISTHTYIYILAYNTYTY